MIRFSKVINITLLILLIGLAAAVIIFLVYDFSSKNTDEDRDNRKATQEENLDNSGPKITTPKATRYDEAPAKDGAKYFEKMPIIEGQQAYIAYPLEIVTSEPPTLIVYNHGSNTTVTTNLNDQFMKDLQYYGEFFTSKGYAFAASNQHGKNEGSQTAIDDNNNLIKWISDRYKIKAKVNLIGFSMGGRPTIYYTQQNAEKVNSIAMLAPATCYCTSALYNSLKEIPIKIWHGTADANVPYSAALEFINRGKPYDLNITLRTIDDVGHFDIDTEYAQEIYEFFLANEPAN